MDNYHSFDSFAHILVGFGTWLNSIVSMVKTFAVQ